MALMERIWLRSRHRSMQISIVCTGNCGTESMCRNRFLQRLIPKAGQPGRFRPLGIPTIYDRVCQQALLNRLGPIFEPVFDDANYGYRQGRSTHGALRKIWRELDDVVKHALLTPRNPAKSMGYRADRHRIRAPINSGSRGQAGPGDFPSHAFAFQLDAMRWALWTIRSRMASTTVASLIGSSDLQGAMIAWPYASFYWTCEPTWRDPMC